MAKAVIGVKLTGPMAPLLCPRTITSFTVRDATSGTRQPHAKKAAPGFRWQSSSLRAPDTLTPLPAARARAQNISTSVDERESRNYVEHVPLFATGPTLAGGLADPGHRPIGWSNATQGSAVGKELDKDHRSSGLLLGKHAVTVSARLIGTWRATQPATSPLTWRCPITPPIPPSSRCRRISLSSSQHRPRTTPDSTQRRELL